MAVIEEPELSITPVGSNQQEVKVTVAVQFGNIEVALMKSLLAVDPNATLFVITCDIFGYDRAEGLRGGSNLLFRISPSKYLPKEGIESTMNVEFVRTVLSNALNEDRGGRVRGGDEIMGRIEVHDQYLNTNIGRETNVVRGRF